MTAFYTQLVRTELTFAEISGKNELFRQNQHKSWSSFSKADLAPSSGEEAGWNTCEWPTHLWVAVQEQNVFPGLPPRVFRNNKCNLNISLNAVAVITDWLLEKGKNILASMEGY